MAVDTLEQIGQSQRDRLFHIEFCALFLGLVRRADLMARFGVAQAAATPRSGALSIARPAESCVRRFTEALQDRRHLCCALPPRPRTQPARLGLRHRRQRWRYLIHASSERATNAPVPSIPRRGRCRVPRDL